MQFKLTVEDKELDLIMLSMQQTVRSINDVASSLQNQAQQIVFEQQEKARQEVEQAQAQQDQEKHDQEQSDTRLNADYVDGRHDLNLEEAYKQQADVKDNV